MKEKDIKRISSYFKISEEAIKKVLEEASYIPPEVDLEKAKQAKSKFLKSNSEEKRLSFLKDWLANSAFFDDIEEIFVYTENDKELKMVIEHWLTLCREANQARKVYQCCPEDENLKSKVLRTWISLCDKLEDIREANQYTKEGSDEKNIAVKKILKFY